MIVDEAQAIDDFSILEELRLLLNIQRDDAVLFTLLLLGQVSLVEYIEKNPQLKQRLSLRYYIHPLKKQDTQGYIQHRLNVAGLDRKIFDDSAYDEIFSLSGGVPRVINNICDLALLTGFITEKSIIDRDIVTQAGKDLDDCFYQSLRQKNK
jgi:general secretion pathway protein A